MIKMINLTKKLIRNVLPKSFLETYYENIRQKDYANWMKANCPIPPTSAAKQIILRAYQKKSGIKILVETGTYYGDMVFAQLKYFETIFSIELSEYFYQNAVKRFRGYDNVRLYQGDSSIVLSNVVSKINEPILFWLDGHYSGGDTAKGVKECPILEELAVVISRKKPDIILIDDARLFIGENDYPTIDELKQFFENQSVKFSFEVKDDIIRVILS
jgi:hypothetical protein